MLYVCVRGVMDVVFLVCIVTRGASCLCMGSMSVLSCRCCMFVSCVHPVAYGRGILQSWSHDCLIGSHECLLPFTPSCCCECFYHL